MTVCRVISYAPGRALFPPFHSYVSKATTLPRAGFLPLFYNNADPVKSLHVKSIQVPEPISSPSPYLQRANILSLCSKFYKLAVGLTSGPWATGRGACRFMLMGRTGAAGCG